jgi:hypothetical protein
MPGPTDQKRLGQDSHFASPELSKPAEPLSVIEG